MNTSLFRNGAKTALLALLLTTPHSHTFAEEGFSSVISSAMVGSVESSDPEGHLISALSNHVDNSVASKMTQWLGNTEVSLRGLLDGKPQFGILNISPWYESDNLKDTIFSQASFYNYHGRQTLNAGLGYRRMTDDERWLLGVNAFYDYEFPYDHRRASIGLEARSSVIEFNANRYLALSSWTAGLGGLNERALDGYDVEAGVTMPYMPNARLYHRQFSWDAVDGIADMKGRTTSFQMQGDFLIPGLTLAVGATSYDGSREDNNFLKLTYRFTKSETEVQPLFTNEMYNFVSMRKRRLDRVRRTNLIIKQFQGRGTISFR